MFFGHCVFSIHSLKEGCYKEQRYVSYVGADILDDGVHVPIHVSSLNNGIDARKKYKKGGMLARENIIAIGDLWV